MCLTAIVGGILAADLRSGIGFERPDGTTYAVQWPFGWTGWRDGDDLVLVDAELAIVGRLGDNKTFGGGWAGDNDDLAAVCVAPEGG